MLRRLGLLCSVLALFFIAGGHWTVVQTVAWAEMLHDYTQRTGSLTAAVEQTFDGQHPCEVCRDIQAAKSREHNGNPLAPGAKYDTKVKALLADSTPLCAQSVRGTFTFPASVVLVGPDRVEPPPVPPPRLG